MKRLMAAALPLFVFTPVCALAQAQPMLVPAPPVPPAQDDAVWVSGWMVSQISSGTCQAVGFLGDQTTIVSFIDTTAGPPRLALLNRTWNLAKGRAYQVSLSWDGWKTSRTYAFTSDQVASGMSILIGNVGPEFRAGMTATGMLGVRVAALTLDADTVVEHGGAPLMAAVTTCMQKS